MSQSLKLITLWLRILLLGLSLLACTILLLWQFKGDWVTQFDTLVVKSYQGYYKYRFGQVVKVTSQNPQKGIVVLSQFLDDLSHVRKRDRLDEVKRKAYAALVKELDGAERNNEAISWAEEWTTFDERDLNGQIWRVKLMRKSSDQNKESWVLIRDLYRRVPNSMLIVSEYAESLMERGAFTDAFLAVYDVFEQQDTFSGQIWQVFWDTGDGFNAKQMHDVHPVLDDDVLSFGLKVPDHVVKLRIDLPMASSINLVNPLLTDDVDVVENRLSFLEVPIGLSDMVKTRTGFKSVGEWDPYFYWDMSSVTLFSGELFFVCTVAEPPPVNLEKILRLADRNGVEKELIARNQMQRAEQWQALVEEYETRTVPLLFKDTFLEIFWKNKSEEFSVKRQVRKFLDGTVEDGVYKFEEKFTIASSATEMRIDFPSIKGQKYRLGNVELLSDGWSHNIDLRTTKPLQLHMMKNNGAVFEVTGNDPYFVFSVPYTDKIIEHVIVQGEAQ